MFRPVKGQGAFWTLDPHHQCWKYCIVQPEKNWTMQWKYNKRLKDADRSNEVSEEEETIVFISVYIGQGSCRILYEILPSNNNKIYFKISILVTKKIQVQIQIPRQVFWILWSEEIAFRIWFKVRYKIH